MSLNMVLSDAWAREDEPFPHRKRLSRRSAVLRRALSITTPTIPPPTVQTAIRDSPIIYPHLLYETKETTLNWGKDSPCAVRGVRIADPNGSLLLLEESTKTSNRTDINRYLHKKKGEDARHCRYETSEDANVYRLLDVLVPALRLFDMSSPTPPPPLRPW